MKKPKLLINDNPLKPAWLPSGTIKHRSQGRDATSSHGHELKKLLRLPSKEERSSDLSQLLKTGSFGQYTADFEVDHVATHCSPAKTKEHNITQDSWGELLLNEISFKQ